MYQIGDTVMHPSEGICAIEGIRSMQFAGVARDYYVLKPSAENSSSTVYLPVERGNTVLRKLLSRKDVVDMIHQSVERADLWVADNKKRKEVFQRVLDEGDYPQIIHIIGELYAQGERRQGEGKKRCASDDALLEQAERRIHQEFSYVLHMNQSETVDFICRELGVSRVTM